MYHHEVEKYLKASITGTPAKKYFDPKKYMGTHYTMLGIPVPRQREIFKNGFSFSHLPPRDQLAIWDEVWKKSNLFEVLSQSLFFTEKYVNKINTPELLVVLENWLPKIDNWGHSDSLSSIFARMMVKDPHPVFTRLQAWNDSDNPWYKRQSIVPLAMYYRSNNLLPFNGSMALIQHLLMDEDYFVQKGVGWSLREIGTQYPRETWNFLLKNAGAISSVAFSASVEKLTPSKKEKLKTIRRNK
jgi:3-methyladenine DNA glycosylase AlkD